MDKHILYPTEAGVPQGGVASPVMMNLALNGLERHIKNAIPTSQGGVRTKVHTIRFADDFIITGRSKAFLEEEVQPLVAQFLAERGLELSHEKTRVTHIEDGFDFLGSHVHKYRSKLLNAWCEFTPPG
jgi:RNA-directed DNA polymerase